VDRRYYSRRHFELLRNGPPDTAETIAERLRQRAAAEQAMRERDERWPELTAENAGEALVWQRARERELCELLAAEKA